MSNGEVAAVISGVAELAKLGLQLWFANSRMAGLTDKQIDDMLDSERERFRKNVSTPLPDV